MLLGQEAAVLALDQSLEAFSQKLVPGGGEKITQIHQGWLPLLFKHHHQLIYPFIDFFMNHLSKLLPFILPLPAIAIEKVLRACRLHLFSIPGLRFTRSL